MNATMSLSQVATRFAEFREAMDAQSTLPILKNRKEVVDQ